VASKIEKELEKTGDRDGNDAENEEMEFASVSRFEPTPF